MSTWIFTFGSGQKHAGHFVRIQAESWIEARREMFDRFGDQWGFQYTEEEWNEWERNRPPYVPIETELEQE